MIDKEKLEKIKELADAMYYAAQQLTTDASRLHKAMDEYHKFIIYEYHKEEPVSEDLENIVEEIAEPTILNAYGTKELARRLRNTICGTSVSEGLEDAAVEWFNSIKYKSDLSGTPINAFKAGAQWKEKQMMVKAIDAQCFGFQGAALFSFRLPADNYLVGSKVKVIVIKED